MTHRHGIAITRRYPAELLQTLPPTADVVAPTDNDSSLSRAEILAGADRLVALINQGEFRVDADLLRAASRLRIVANASIGVNNLALDEIRARGIWVTNAPAGFVDATADCVIGLLLMLVRRLGEADRHVRAGRWTAFAPGIWDGMLLRGKKLGLVGYGRIGQAVAARAAAFGLETIYCTRTPPAVPVPGWRTLEALLAEADIVSLHVPLHASSERMIDASRFASMKPGACLINVARGPVVDEGALIAALSSGRLAGAALDVFADEPNVPPALREMENVVLTPHLGGGSREGRWLAQETCIENVARVLRGEKPLAHTVVLAADG